MSQSNALNLRFRKAVAPTFVPFVFGEPGIAEASVKVEIDQSGKVISATTIEASPFRDRSFEKAAMQWTFEPCRNSAGCRQTIKFVLRIMPKGTPPEEITTRFTYPAEVEVRSPIIELTVADEPIPVRTPE